MKQITLVLSCLVIAAAMQAQTRVGFQAGAVSSNLKVKAGDFSGSSKTRSGFTAGLFLEAPLGQNLYISPALNYVQKGSKVKDDFIVDNLSLHFLEVPLNLIYAAKPGSSVFLGGGPSISMGIAGREKANFGDGTGSETTKVKFGNGEDEVKRLEFGANLLAGYKTKGGFSIAANYNHGLSKLNHDAQGEGTIKSWYVGLRLGLLLNR